MEALLALDEIEAVYIASPVFCHKEQAIVAAKAKKDILIEKPVGMNVAEAEEIAAFCEAQGVKLGVGFMMRFHAYHQKMREVITEGKIGEIVSVRSQFTCWYPEIEGAWRQDMKLSGGGAMMDLGVHCVDLVRYITGLEIVEAAGLCGNQIFKYSVEDAGGVVFRMENGAIGYVDANFNIPDAAAKCPLEFYGTKGSMIAVGTLSQDEGGSVEVLVANDNAGYDAQQNRSLVEPMKLDVTFGNMYTKEVEAFSNAVINNTEPPVNGKNTMRVHEIIASIYSNGGGKF
jgi:predicted dehydrogenase